MATEERIIKVKTVYDMAQPVNTLTKLEEEAKKAEKAAKALETQLKRTKDATKKDELAAQFVEAKLAAEKATKAVEDHRKTLDLNKLTYNQLKTHVDKLNAELGKLTPNTEAWKKKLTEVGTASQHLNKAKTEIDKIKKGGEELAKPGLWQNITNRFKSMNTALLDLGVGGVASLAAIGMAVKSAFTYVTDTFIDFEQAAADTKGELGLTEKQIKDLRDEAQKIGPQFGKTAKEMVEAYNAVGSGKSELVDTKNGLQDVTNAAITLSTVGQMDMKESAKVMVESLNQYGVEAKEAAKFVDILATGTKVGAATINEISESLKFVGPVAKSANVSFAQTNAALQVLSQNGIKSEMAGTSLRGTLLELASSSDKTINPTVVGLQKAMENLAAKNYSAAQMADLVGKTNVSAAIALRDNVGKLKDWTAAIEKGGGASEMYADKTNTLKFQISQVKAEVLNYALSIGEKLAPVISTAIKITLSFISGIAAIPKFLNDNKVAIGGLAVALLAFNGHLIKTNAQILYNAAVTKGKLVWDKASAVATNIMTVAQNGLNLAMKANPVGLVISALVALGTIIYTTYQKSQTFRAGIAGLWALMKEGATIISRIWTALKNLDFKAVATELTNATTNMAKAFTKGYAEKIKEESKKATDSISKDNKQQTKDDDTKTKKLKNNATELTDAQKKALEDRKKAQQEALKQIDELENEAYVEHVRRTQGEVAAEKIKLQQTADAQLLAVQKSLATTEQKGKQQKLITDKLQKDLENLEEQHQKTNAEIVERWTDSEIVKKVKKAQNFANTEITIARKTIQDKEKLAAVELKINEWLKNELAALEQEKAATAIGESTKRLNSEKFILEQEQKAELAVMAGLELAHRGNAKKLIDLRKERYDLELKQLLAKLELEKKAEELKLKAEIKDQEELKAALENLNAAYEKREVEEKAKTEAAKTDLEKKASEQRQKMRQELSSAFGALLKGDLTAFAGHLDSIVQGEKSAWQKRLNENMGSYQMIGQMAVQAANFLNDLTQKRVAKEIEEVKREFAEKKAILDASILEEANTIAVAEQQKRDLKAQFSEEVKGIKNANEQMISDAEKFYNELSSADANAKFNEQVTLANQQADEKSRSAQRASSDAIDAARNERDESIIAAEATRDAEITAINARADLDTQTKQRLIEAARAKAELEINLATDEAETKMKLSKEEMEQKIKDAEEEKEAKIKLMEELMTADEERAKELLAAAEAEAEKKVELAEQEKNEKLKILEQEKAKRVSSKKELERQLAEEDKKAKNNEAQLKYKAAMTQWKTDQVSALVNGALATVKALASGFFPLNLVFAALTAVATGIQIAAIRSNRPAAPPSFAVGGSAPRIGVGGLPNGGRHGSQYGESGIALVNRQTGREEGEMEGGEAIISRDQTEANLPLIQMMWKKARTRDKTPVMPMQDFKPLAFVHGGLAPTPSDRQMFLFGSKKRKAADAAAAAEAEAAAAAEADAGSVDTADAEAAHAEAKKQGEEQLKLLTEIRDGITVVSEEIMKVAKSTGETTSATRAVEKAVRDTNQGGKLDGMIGLISSLGKKTAA